MFESKFERGDVIVEEHFRGKTIQYVVLDTIHPEVIYVYSQDGFCSSIAKETENLYTKIGYIDLKPLCDAIKEM